MIGKCVPCDTSIVRCLDTKQQWDWLNLSSNQIL